MTSDPEITQRQRIQDMRKVYHDDPQYFLTDFIFDTLLDFESRLVEVERRLTGDGR